MTTPPQSDSSLPTSSCATRRISCDGSLPKDRPMEGNEENQPTQPRITAKVQLVVTPPSAAPSTAKALSTLESEGPIKCLVSSTETDLQQHGTESIAASHASNKVAKSVSSPNAADAANALSSLQKFCLIAQGFEDSSVKSPLKSSPPQLPSQEQEKPPKEEPTTPPMAVPTPSPTEHNLVTADPRSSPPQLRDVPPECPPMPTSGSYPPPHPSYSYLGRPLPGATPLPPPPSHGCYPPNSAARSFYGRMAATPISSSTNNGANWQRPQGLRQPDPPSWHSPHPHGPASPFAGWNRNAPPPPAQQQQQQPELTANGSAPRCTCGNSHNQQSATPSNNKFQSPTQHWRHSHIGDPNRAINSMQPHQIRWESINPTCSSSQADPDTSNPWQRCSCESNNKQPEDAGKPTVAPSSSPRRFQQHPQQAYNHHDHHQPPMPPQRQSQPQQQHPNMGWSGYKELERLLVHVSPNMRSAVWNSVDRIVREQAHEYRRAATGFIHSSGPHSTEYCYQQQSIHDMPLPKRVTSGYSYSEVVPSSMTMPTNSRKRGVGGDDLDLRRDIKKMKTVRDKVQLLRQIQTKVQSEGLEDSKLTEGARTFVCRSLRPIMGCFTKHCNSDIDRFCAKWPKLAISSFACNGNRQECIIGDCHAKENHEQANAATAETVKKS